MSDFNHKKQIVNTHLVVFKKRLFIINDQLIGIDQGILAIFSDGVTEMLYMDCEDPNYTYSAEMFETINPKDNVEKLKKEYAELYGKANGLHILLDTFIKLDLNPYLISDDKNIRFL